MHNELLEQTLVLLLLAVTAIVLFRRINMPPILGYLVIGILTGPHILGWLQNDEITTLLGEFGVVFLLFTIGLEFSLSEFIRLRYSLLGLGGAQVLIGTICGMAIAMLIGFDWQAALIMGGALSLSSTAIVVKQLSEQLELQQQHGRLAISILLFQDIAAIPFLVMIPIFAQTDLTNLSSTLFFALVKGVIALTLLLLFSRWLVRPLFHEVARTRLVELFTLTVLLVSLAAAWVTHLMGLSLAFGAFIAGMMLGETQYRHQIEAEIRPFRDVLLGLFFITVGNQLNIFSLGQTWPWVLLLVCGVVLGKSLLITLLTWISKYPMATALRTGLALGHGGEFSIALISLSLVTGLISHPESQPILAATIISMIIAPFLIRNPRSIIKWLIPSTTHKSTVTNDEIGSVSDLHHHVILCGYGRTGQHIKNVLTTENIAYVAIDNNSELIKSHRMKDKMIFFGDASDSKLLESLGIQHAAAVIITFDELTSALKIITNLRSSGYELPIISRAHDQHDLETLLEAGATEVVPEDLETSLMLITQLMLVMGIPLDEVLERLNQIKQDHYKLLNTD